MKLHIDRDRLLSEIEALAAISDADPPAVTRIVFTPTDLKARAWLRAHCEEAGLVVRQDAIGNTFARWPGSDPEAPAVGTGSHIDAIPNAGKYDGVVGVLGAWQRYERCSRADFVPGIRSSCWFSLRRSRRASASAAWAADCSPEPFLPMPRKD